MTAAQIKKLCGDSIARYTDYGVPEAAMRRSAG